MRMNSRLLQGLLSCLPFLLAGCTEELDDLIKEGEPMEIHAAFSIHDDDTMDKNLPSSLATGDWNGGYATKLFPLMQSLGIKPCLSMEGKRVGFTDSIPALNENGRVVKHLQDNYGWEIMAHSMTAPYVRETYWVDSLNSPLADKILREGTYGIGGARTMGTTTVYEKKTGRNYVVTPSLTSWVELPREWIRPYVKDYSTKKVTRYNPSFPIDYQWGTFLDIARRMGFSIDSAVMPATTGSHACIPGIKSYVPHIFEVIGGIAQYNTIPLTATVHRISLEAASETSTNNLYNKRELKEWKKLVDQAAAHQGWIIFYLHSYRKCWTNCIEEELVSRGGTYPDEWVEPIKAEDGIMESFSTPPPRLGISSWEEWYPCPGTRLSMLHELLLYIKEKGLDNLLSREGFARFGNILEEGLYTKGGQIGQDRYWIEGTEDRYPYHVIGADGRELRYPKPE